MASGRLVIHGLMLTSTFVTVRTLYRPIGMLLCLSLQFDDQKRNLDT
jgi:hypothetical protein